MTIETEDYTTRTAIKIAKDIRTSNGWRSLHTDFINNDKSQGYRVTYVNEIDDPDKTPEVIAQREAQKIEQERIIELKQKIKDRTISQLELLELLEKLL